MLAVTEKMGDLIIEEILKATGGRLLCGRQREVSGLSIDSRTIKQGELFVALRGSRFDGHDFVHDALQTGAGALVNLPPAEPAKGKVIIYVKNTLQALHDIARYLRQKLNVPVIGVTGTNGKTTTKELIASIFGLQNKVLKTAGNLNNHIGLPLSISRMDGDETIIILEMGSNAPGDIHELCGIAQPDFAVVTNVGPAHLEGFGSLEMIRNTDLEILQYVKTVAANADDHFLMEGLRDFGGKIITYGIDSPADVSAKDIILKDRGSSFRLCLPKAGDMKINLGITGRMNISNALAAASITHALGVDPGEIRKGIESFEGVTMRFEIKELFGSLVISDVYNANPASMEEAVKELIRLKRKRTIAVLGDMLELGSYTEDAHRKLLSWMSGLKVDLLVAVGPAMTRASAEFKGPCYTADDAVHARPILLNICREGDTVLVKGSRGMHMERVLSDSERNLEGYAV